MVTADKRILGRAFAGSWRRLLGKRLYDEEAVCHLIRRNLTFFPKVLGEIQLMTCYQVNFLGSIFSPCLIGC